MKARLFTPEEINKFLITYMTETLNKFCFENPEELTLPAHHTSILLERENKSDNLVIRVSGNKDKEGNLRRFEIFLVHLK